MANALRDKNNNDSSSFDDSNYELVRNERNVFTYFRDTLNNRYIVLSAIFCFFGICILVMSARLQFSDYQRKISEESEGKQMQFNVSAPRGDIYDSQGTLLASSKKTNKVLLANASLEDEELNALCLELSDVFEEYYCTSLSKLDDYFGIEPFEFKKDEDDIIKWQTDRNLFDLKDYSQGVIVTFSDEYVKTDPQIFFLYLRNLFKIDNKYSDKEAYQIIRIRYQIFQDQWAFDHGTPVEIAIDVPQELINIFNEQNYHYRGIVSSVDYRRYYTPHAEASSHVLGYVGKISPEQYNIYKKFGYINEDLVGQDGVEYQMDRYLHGNYGVSTYSIWGEKEENGTFFPNSIGVEPEAGATCNLTINTDVQVAGIQAVKDYIDAAKKDEMERKTGYKTANSGSFAVMDVETGALIGMGSYPDFDPNDFVLAQYDDEDAKDKVKYYLGIDEYEEKASDMPLWNRAMKSQYAPGSTFKMCTALAGLDSGKITPNSNTIECEGPLDVDGWPFRCLEFPYGGHGPLSLSSATATSCNIYFMKLGVSTGIDAIASMSERLGLGELTGVDLPGETKGIRASRETKRRLHESEYDKTWFRADTAQSAIGQFDNCFTVLQLCRYTAAIATNKLVTPHVVDNVVASDGTILYEGNKDSVPLNIPESHLEAVRRGMHAVVKGDGKWPGSAQGAFTNFPIDFCCKTGTAETGLEEIRKEYSNGLFVCYAPADKPKIAIALCVERGEWGSNTAVVARRILAAYFNVSYEPTAIVTEDKSIDGDVLDEPPKVEPPKSDASDKQPEQKTEN